MFAYLLILINLTVSILGIYLFDHQVDGVINSPLIILLSLLSGTIVMVLVFFLYVEIFYILFGKNDPYTSKRKHFIAKQLMTIPIVWLNIRVTVLGKENLPKDTGFSIYSNHTSMMDIPIFMYHLKDYPVAFLAKEVVRNIFSLGKWTPALGGVMLDRSNARKGAESIIKVIKNVKNGSTMVIFPEGTRAHKLNTLLDFKPGSFKVALKSKRPLVPVTLVKSKKRPWPLPDRVTMVIHKPLLYNDFKQMTSNELAETVKNTINKPFEKRSNN